MCSFFAAVGSLGTQNKNGASKGRGKLITSFFSLSPVFSSSSRRFFGIRGGGELALTEINWRYLCSHCEEEGEDPQGFIAISPSQSPEIFKEQNMGKIVWHFCFFFLAFCQREIGLWEDRRRGSLPGSNKRER